MSVRKSIQANAQAAKRLHADSRVSVRLMISNSLNPFANEPNAMAASAIEVASEACDEEDEHQRHMQTSNASSPSEPSDANSWRRRDLVSMVTFR